jgi:hypothetical protein
MKASRFSEEQIIGVLREHEAGAKTEEVCRVQVPGVNFAHRRGLLMRSLDGLFGEPCPRFSDYSLMTKMQLSVHKAAEERGGNCTLHRRSHLGRRARCRFKLAKVKQFLRLGPAGAAPNAHRPDASSLRALSWPA